MPCTVFRHVASHIFCVGARKFFYRGEEQIWGQLLTLLCYAKMIAVKMFEDFFEGVGSKEQIGGSCPQPAVARCLVIFLVLSLTVGLCRPIVCMF